MSSFAIQKINLEEFYVKKEKYPFSQMSIGDSFLVQDFNRAQSARVSAIAYAKRTQSGWKFSIKKTTDGWHIFRVL